MATTNWEQIRTEYVTAEISLRDLADKQGVARSQVFERSRREGWVTQRRAFRSRAGAKAEQEAEDEAVEATALIYRVARVILERFLKAVEEEGLKLAPKDAAQWARILLELEDAGRGQTMIIERMDLSQLSDEQLDALIAGAGSLE